MRKKSTRTGPGSKPTVLLAVDESSQHCWNLKGWRIAALLAAGLNLPQGAALAEEVDTSSNFKWGGYVRAWSSFNLQNQPDTPNYNARGKMSMLRESANLYGDYKTGGIAWHGVIRSDVEQNTDYEKQLAKTMSPGGPYSDPAATFQKTDLRELTADFDVGDRVHLRLGKQQVVWGETDLFHPTDLFHGYENTWRFFLEGEPDELRKPLIMANAQIKVPEANGSLQVVVRPGWDRKQDIGNSYMFGGRWGQTPGKGFDPFAPGSGGGAAHAFGIKYDHSAGDYKTPTGGLRWTGLAGPLNYALSAQYTFAPEPVISPAANPYQGVATTGAAGDVIYPLIKVYSASVGGEIPSIDTVATMELSYQDGNLFNSGVAGAASGLAGGPLVKKNVVKTTLRFDKTLRLMDVFGTSNPSLSSLQIFDTATLNLNDSEQVLLNVGHPMLARKHTTVASYFFSLPYDAGRFEPGLLIARYLQSGDMLIVPSVKFNYGNHWRFLVEADIFKAKHSDSPGNPDPQFSDLGGFVKSNQLLFRATYQF